MTLCWEGEVVREMTVTCSNMVCLEPRVTRGMPGCLAIMVTRVNMEPRVSEVMRVSLGCEVRSVMLEPQGHLDTKETQEQQDLLDCQVSMASTDHRG